ncbi:MAG: bifunctional hydroxymethylpyrimidine kinase/phosphomethylpyrimidine kinase [Alphaproteobacteria bacterium]|nr:bifunctional hydroxymethylpyrimidine kinase/phosphomethylpyrimidine kinase [Alphaproteobacteria bacterium]HPF46614.1 bifunctional hydroxymethylpyrimidine kinase/phosphomethylpyrimidine kinase [Emcibacteraceae bacterium]HRW30323.1 bifunctional hydroxymethylpyrimidine kinase/phosphomethylpyrimidine kinase [Emcibacteraceae bacterium]
MKGKVLTIAGSDSSGGAGIQADIKTISSLGAYAMSAITAITVQDTNMVSEVFPIPAKIVKAQILSVLGDIGADAIKTGMLLSPDIILAVSDVLKDHGQSIPLVVDPVMMSTSGHMLLKPHSVNTLVNEILPKTTLLTPNLAEAAKLTGTELLKNMDDMRRAADDLLKMGPKAVLIKGGHLKGDILTDLLVTQNSEKIFSSLRVPGKDNHGTGCTLASGIATGLAQEMTLVDAVARAHNFVHKALEHAPGFGSGCGPINHLVTVD